MLKYVTHYIVHIVTHLFRFVFCILYEPLFVDFALKYVIILSVVQQTQTYTQKQKSQIRTWRGRKG